MVRRRDMVACVGRAGAAWPAVASPPSGFHAAQTPGAPVLNGLDRVCNLNDLEGGFFVIAKPRAAILPRTGRKLFTKREATYAKRLLAGCTPAALRGLGAIRGLTFFGARCSASPQRIRYASTARARGRDGAVGYRVSNAAKAQARPINMMPEAITTTRSIDHACPRPPIRSRCQERLSSRNV
jgi:hypothetical protein